MNDRKPIWTTEPNKFREQEYIEFYKSWAKYGNDSFTKLVLLLRKM
jgi:HSP90 family molecular chaperone